MRTATRLSIIILLMLIIASVSYYFVQQQNFTFNNTPAGNTSLTELNCSYGYYQLKESCVAIGSSTVFTTSSTPSGSAGSNPNSGSSSCFGCVTITDISANVVDSNMSPECYIPNADYGSLGMVIGPNVQGSARTFAFEFHISAAYGQQTDGTLCNNNDDLYNLYIDSSNLIPISIQSVSPSLPFVVPNGATQDFFITFQVLAGNYYSGALALTMQISGD